MFKIFSQPFKHLYRRASESTQNQRLKKNMIMLKRDHSQWFIGVFHMIWITVLASSPSEFFVFSSFWVSFGLWYCMEMRHFNGKWKPCEHTAVMRLLGAGFSLDGAGFVWCHLREETLNIISHHQTVCSKTQCTSAAEVTSCGSINMLSQSVLGTVLLLV